MAEKILQVSGISKSFRLNKNVNDNLKEKFQGLLRSKRTSGESFQALSNISFTVRRGETIGIIGKNGSGKSTLLKILSGITPPDEGTVEFYGKSASVLEIGTGFNPELTGLENIYFSSALYGITEKEIEKKLQTIIDFSGVADFLHEPVKNYSSGMYLRLAFSIIAHIDADILILDEVMSTGDAEFQLKSQEKMAGLVNEGKTLLIVSHNLSELARMVKRIIHIDQGKVIRDDSAVSVLDSYISKTYVDAYSKKAGNRLTPFTPPYVFEGDLLDNDFFTVEKLSITRTGGAETDDLSRNNGITVRSVCKAKAAINLHMGLSVFDTNGNTVLTTLSLDNKPGNSPSAPADTIEHELNFPAYFLNSGMFSARFFYMIPGEAGRFDQNFEVPDRMMIKIMTSEVDNPILEKIPGYLRPKLDWHINYLK